MALHLTGCEWPSAEHEPRGCPTPGACFAADQMTRLRAALVKAREYVDYPFSGGLTAETRALLAEIDEALK